MQKDWTGKDMEALKLPQLTPCESPSLSLALASLPDWNRFPSSAVQIDGIGFIPRDAPPLVRNIGGSEHKKIQPCISREESQVSQQQPDCSWHQRPPTDVTFMKYHKPGHSFEDSQTFFKINSGSLVDRLPWPVMNDKWGCSWSSMVEEVCQRKKCSQFWIMFY